MAVHLPKGQTNVVRSSPRPLTAFDPIKAEPRHTKKSVTVRSSATSGRLAKPGIIRARRASAQRAPVRRARAVPALPRRDYNPPVVRQG